MNNQEQCAQCGKRVYKAEEKRFDHPKAGVMIFHGLCFGVYKKDYDRAVQDEKNREYYKPADVQPTKNT